MDEKRQNSYPRYRKVGEKYYLYDQSNILLGVSDSISVILEVNKKNEATLLYYGETPLLINRWKKIQQEQTKPQGSSVVLITTDFAEDTINQLISSPDYPTTYHNMLIKEGKEWVFKKG